MANKYHDTHPSAICLCPDCIDDVSAFVSTIDTLEEAHWVSEHILNVHQSQLIQIHALKAVIEEKDPQIQILRQQVDMMREYVKDHAAGRDVSPPRFGLRLSPSLSEQSVDEQAKEQIVKLKLQLKSSRVKEYDNAMRIKAAANHYVKQAYYAGLGVQAENKDLRELVKVLRAELRALKTCEQSVVDEQIRREMHEAEARGGQQEFGM